jgi:hypothetical protein
MSRLQEERHEDVPRLRVLAVFLFLVPLHVDQLGHPGRSSADQVAVTLLLKNAGQPDSIRQIAGEPLLLNTGVLTVERKTPLARQRSSRRYGIHAPAGGACTHHDAQSQQHTAVRDHLHE